ncbi:MAG: rhodanese-like domain-containing protein [Aquificae bacterium]|nr:rhodanese-like domain-containing protein [Aquificota bacterium]
MKKLLTPSNGIFFLLLLAGAFYYLYVKGIILADFENLEPKEAFQLLQKERDKVILVDVRTPEEVKTDGRIPGSILIPLGDLPNKIDLLDRDKKILVYCRSGNRSVSAARLLSKLGYKVYNIKGGIKRWKAEGLPVEKTTSF